MTTTTTTPTSGAADLPEALRLADLFELESDPESLYRLAAAELRRLHALAAGRATAAQPGVVYAELPAPNYPKSGGFPGTFAEAQMRAFADATCALRASHGQAPAQTADSQLLQFYGVTTDAELIAAQAAHIEKLQAKLTKTPSFAPQRVREG